MHTKSTRAHTVRCAWLLLLLLTLVWPSRPVHGGECLPGGIARAITVRVDQRALELALPLLAPYLPDRVAVPDEPMLVGECDGDFDDTVLTPDGMEVQLTIRSLALTPLDSALDLEATVDVQVTGGLYLQLCALPDDHCQLDVDARSVQLRSRLTPVVEECTARAQLVSSAIAADPAQTTIRLEQCSLYSDVWDLVYEWFGDWILEQAQVALEDVVAEYVPPLLEEFSTSILAKGLEVYGYHVAAAVEELVVQPEAIITHFAADVRPTGPWPACLPADATLPVELPVPAPVPSSGAHVSCTISPAMLSRAVGAAWLGGSLCFDSGELGLDLSTPLDFLVPDAQVQARLSVAQPPALLLAGTPAEAAATVTASQVLAEVRMEVPGRDATLLSAQVAAEFSGRVGVDPATQAVSVALTGARSTGAAIAGTGLGLSFSAGTLQSMLDQTLLPLYAAYVGRVPLLGNVFAQSPLALAARIERVGSREGFLELDWELIAKVPEDQQAPETILGDLSDDPQPEEVKIPVASVDDTTPTRFLRHLVRIDGGPELEPLEGTLLQLPDQPHGRRLVTLAAVDLQGNRDPTPLTVAVQVDMEDPVVLLTGAPRGVTREARASIRVEARDETSPAERMRLWYRFGEVLGDNLPDRVLEQGSCRSGEVLTFDLPEGQLVRLFVEASDVAGNRGNEAVVFVRNGDPTLACRLAPHAGSGVGVLGLALLLGLARLRLARPAGAPPRVDR